ncbi:MAG: zinc-ribbon domain-containing protein [Desulfatitalea sp.]
MFITCQECNTTFRLDERLLKPTGSKVRCSQCRYTFIAAPPSPKSVRKQTAMTPAFEALTDEGPASAVNEELEDQGLDGIDLAELDSILEGEAASAGPEARQGGRAVPDADVASGDDVDDLDEIDLDFDFDAALETEGKEMASPSVTTDEPSDELSLEMDFEIDDDTLMVKKEGMDGLDLAALTVEEEPVKAPGKAVSESEPSLEDDLDLAFKDLDLGAEEKPVQTPVASKGKDKKSDDLDLDDLDFDLADESKTDGAEREDMELSLADESEPSIEKTAPGKSAKTTSKAADKTPKEDLGLGLELDLGELGLEPSPKAPAKSPLDVMQVPKDDLDLDLDLDMGEALEMEPSPKKAVAEEKDELSLDLESDFNLESEAKATAEPAAGDAVEEDLEELNFELDTEFDEKPAAKAPKAPKAAVAADEELQDDGIDLSDIEQMLEGDTGAAKKAKPAVVPQESLGLGDTGEIDLTEIESAIDKADEVADDGPEMLEEPELELEFDLDTVAPEAAAKEPAMDIAAGKARSSAEPLDLDLELELENEAPAGKAVEAGREDSKLDLSDLSDLGDLTEEKTKTTKTETVHSGDIELEFQIEEDQGPAVSSKATVGRTAGRVADIPLEQTMETLAAEPKISKRPQPIKPKKKSGKAWVVLLLLLLLAAIGAGVYYAVMYMNVQIPYVSDYLKPKPKDPAGILSLTTMDINSKFIENSQSGRLFVITGKVRNGYSMRRNTIRLQGKLFTKGKVLVKTEFSYAGVMINDQELATLSIAEIKQLLNAAPPPLDATGNVQAGQNLTFMVVFSDLPAADQLDEFAVELVSSLPGQ